MVGEWALAATRPFHSSGVRTIINAGSLSEDPAETEEMSEPEFLELNRMSY